MAETWEQACPDPWWVDAEERDRRRVARNNRIAWLVVITMAFLVFEMTADPALTTAVGCLKFGWDEFRVSRYLRRADPDPVRAQVCSRFYLAVALWRVSAVAVALPLVVACLMSMIGDRARPVRVAAPLPAMTRVVIGAILMTVSGSLVAALLTTWAIIPAFRKGVRVWIGPEAYRACRVKGWPPRTDPEATNSTNRLGILILSTLITWGIIPIIALAFLLGPPRQAGGSGFLSFVTMMSCLIGVPIMIMATKEAIGRRILASSAEECWGAMSDRSGHPDGGWYAAT